MGVLREVLMMGAFFRAIYPGRSSDGKVLDDALAETCFRKKAELDHSTFLRSTWGRGSSLLIAHQYIGIGIEINFMLRISHSYAPVLGVSNMLRHASE